MVSRTWQRDGVRAYGVQSDGTVLCNSTHLTAFSSSTEFRIRVSIFQRGFVRGGIQRVNR